MKSFIFPVSCILLVVLQLSWGQDKLCSYGPLASNNASVSGFSSGGGKALQVYLSYSSQLRGVGVMSGMMYRCDQNQFGELLKLLACSSGRFNYDKVVAKIKEEVDAGLLDPLSNLGSGKQYIHSGTNDIIVSDKNLDAIHKFFLEYSPNVLSNHTDCAHGFPTEGCGPSCSTNFPPIPRTSCRTCGWDGAYNMLNHIYDNALTAPSSPNPRKCSVPDEELPGLKAFNQTEFFPTGKDAHHLNMDKVGYIYVPEACERNASACSLHVHIHGCGHAAGKVGKDDIKCTGILSVADANNIIVLYPQAKFAPNSFSGLGQCWDFVGYTGKNYGNKNGSQTKVIKAMIDRVLGIDSS